MQEVNQIKILLKQCLKVLFVSCFFNYNVKNMNWYNRINDEQGIQSYVNDQILFTIANTS